jgi:hypothetical protein
MRKSTIFLFSILLGIVLILIIVNAVKTEPGVVPISMWTKAICNEENYCIDVQITCGENEVIDIKPTGEEVNHPKDWIDPRPIEMIERWC